MLMWLLNLPVIRSSVLLSCVLGCGAALTFAYRVRVVLVSVNDTILRKNLAYSGLM